MRTGSESYSSKCDAPAWLARFLPFTPETPDQWVEGRLRKKTETKKAWGQIRKQLRATFCTTIGNHRHKSEPT